MTRISVEELYKKTGSKLLSQEQKKINRSIASKKYYLKNKEKIKNKNATYRKTLDIEKKREYYRKYYNLNKDKINEKRKLYTKTKSHKKKIRLYRQKNREKINAQTRIRYNKNKTPKIKKKIIKKNKKIINTELAKKDNELLKYYINNIWNKD